MHITLTARHRARARGCLLGQLTGDALGTTVEFSKAAAIARRYPDGLRDVVGGGPFNVLPGQVTDDSELALSLARALAAHGADFDAIARSYVEWCWSDPFDIGGTTLNAFHFARGTAIDERTVATNAADYNGHPSRQANGSLMRVSPLGIFGAFADPTVLADLARRDSRLSHPSAPCQEACVAFTRAIALAIADAAPPRAAYDAALASVDTPSGRDSGVHGWVLEAADAAPICDAGGTGWVKTALQNAFHRLLHAASFEDGLVATVMAGGDADTNAAIAGALLGAVHGELDIPPAWRETVLGCVTPRGPRYQSRDARELAIALLERGARELG
ncbi:MAG: ribosylglycohydrolase [Deltaproteobacteria bacterium HGW-Deltaproteobacteria-14]|jgi:ADP-ribosylglycohydrolase|nr:MAG: ribosylglycohydrolase [Deltaproteobacteria bacterium HGW-Deltaproteobacteria-14]